MEIDSSKYINIPFKDHGRDYNGLDCWGLVRLVYQDQFDIKLSSYATQYVTTSDHIELGKLVRKERQVDWRSIDLGNEQIGDVILLRLKGEPMHIGVVIKEGYMLHTMKDINVCSEYYLGHLWRHRILGFYRYNGK